MGLDAGSCGARDLMYQQLIEVAFDWLDLHVYRKKGSEPLLI
jgi:hypothetical protein